MNSKEVRKYILKYFNEEEDEEGIAIQTDYVMDYIFDENGIGAREDDKGVFVGGSVSHFLGESGIRYLDEQDVDKCVKQWEATQNITGKISFEDGDGLTIPFANMNFVEHRQDMLTTIERMIEYLEELKEHYY